MKFTSRALFIPLLILIAASASAGELSYPKFKKPELSAKALHKAKRATSFNSARKIKRGEGANVFAKALPSVVKVLTNEGHGSGIVASKRGFILTNYHVIEGYSSVGIVFSTSEDDEEVSIARVVRFDEVADLALLRLNLELPGLIPIDPASQPVNIGDDVHAIGHPLGEDWTYTRGYVSQLRKDYAWQTGVSEHHVANVIQTQTPINPGNSGGPLLNDKGELIGVNSFGNTRGEGINFAIDMTSVSAFLKTKEDRSRQVIDSDLGELVASWDENKNGDPDVYGWDSNGNGKIDILGFDKDENLALEELAIDENENGNPELKIVDGDYLDPAERGVVYFIDEDDDGEFESAGFDVDSDGEIDHFTQG